ncbi:MAG: 23S rRNA (uracil(1939)-C(5))-methyltransferase RlmD [Methylophilaceae bacterium]|nr:23S rRNA (uracil(1939)-C(5))-methyltransferase RlmD [Methylophilaceae bacterium]
MSQGIAIIESLDHEGRGVAHVEGKAVFIEGALPGETVRYRSYRNKPTYEFAALDGILTPSPLRVTPRCPHFGTCGGCAMQHLDAVAQVAAKQRVLEDNLWHIAKVKPHTLLPPIFGPAWGYRHKARLRARYVPAKGRVLVGFNEKASSYVADMRQCEVLPPHISALIVPLQELLMQLSVRSAVPQIEVAVGEQVSVLVFRILEPLEAADAPLVRAFADHHGVQVWLQPKGPETATPFHPLDAPPLTYTLPEFGLTFPFMPTEFTQVNPYINRVLVRRAIALLDPRPGERIADFFCGLGNFTLPIARRGAQVLGLEGSAALVRRARQGAEHNGLAHAVGFREIDLFEVDAAAIAALGRFDKWLIDPPRDGAVELIKAMPDDGPQRIVYVSCNPATLARDAGVLVLVKGYALKAAGVVNMFPHTAHVESIAVFEKK